MAEVDEIAAEVVKRVEQFESQTSSQMNIFVKFEQYWNSLPDVPKKGRKGAKRSPTKANTFVPEFYRCTETRVSDLLSLLFEDIPWFELLPLKFTPEQIVAAFKTQAYIEHMFQEIDFEVKFEPVVRSLARDGTGVMETAWEFKTHWELQPDGTADEVLDYAGPGLEWIPNIGFGFYPYLHEIDTCPYVFKIEKTHPKEIDAIVSGANNFLDYLRRPDEKIVAPNPDDLGDMPASEAERHKEQVRQMQNWTAKPDSEGLVEIIDYWGEHPTKKDSPLVWRIVVVNRSRTIVEIPNPYNHGQKPFIKGVHVHRQRSFYGLGVGHQMWRKQKEVNDFRNLMRDMLNMQLNNMWSRKGGTSEEGDEMTMFPGKVMNENEDGVYTPIRPPIEALESGLRMEEIDKNDMRYVSGATPGAQAIPSGTTATEYKGTMAQTDRHTLQIAKRIAKEMLVPFIRRTLRNIRQFRPKPSLVTVMGIPMEVGPDDVLEAVSVNIKVAAELGMREKMARRTTSALETMLKVSQVPDGKYNFDPIVAHQVKLLGIDPRMVVTNMAKAAGMLRSETGPLQLSQGDLAVAQKELQAEVAGRQAPPGGPPV